MIIKIDASNGITAYAWFKNDKYHNDAKIVCPSDSLSGVCVGISGRYFYIEWWNPNRNYDLSIPLKNGWNFAGVACNAGGLCKVYANYNVFDVSVNRLPGVIGIFESGWNAHKFYGTTGDWGVYPGYRLDFVFDAWISGSKQLRTLLLVHFLKNYLSELPIESITAIGRGDVDMSNLPWRAHVNEPMKSDAVIITDVSFSVNPLARIIRFSKYAKKFLVIVGFTDHVNARKLGTMFTLDGFNSYAWLKRAGFSPLSYEKITTVISVAVGGRDMPVMYYPRIITMRDYERVKTYLPQRHRLSGSLPYRGYAISDMDIVLCEDDDVMLSIAESLNKLFDFKIDLMLPNKIYQTRHGILNKRVRVIEVGQKLHNFCE